MRKSNDYQLPGIINERNVLEKASKVGSVGCCHTLITTHLQIFIQYILPECSQSSNFLKLSAMWTFMCSFRTLYALLGRHIFRLVFSPATVTWPSFGSSQMFSSLWNHFHILAVVVIPGFTMLDYNLELPYLCYNAHQSIWHQKLFNEHVLMFALGLIPEQWRMVTSLSISAAERRLGGIE